MKRVRSETASLPLLSPPSCIEKGVVPASVTMLIAADAQCAVTEGARVAVGFPLCNRPDPGTFASVSGTVRRILPWDAGERGRFTAIIIERGGEDGGHQLFKPVNDPLSLEAADLREMVRLAGFRFPDDSMPVLFSALDEDVDRVVNRYLMEKEFDGIIGGLRLLRHICGSRMPVVALDAALTSDKCRQCAQFGTVISVPGRYPDSTTRQIIRRYPELFPDGHAAVIDSKRLLDFAATLSCGRAPTNMHVSLRIGRRGRIRFFDIPIGTSVGDVLATADGTFTDGMMAVMGGEMTGIAADSCAQPVVDGCDSLLVLPQDETVVSENNPCVNCGRCIDVCPERLRVDLICKNVEFSREKDAVRLGIHQCTHCGLCSAACVVHRPLGHLLAFGKTAYTRVTRQEGAA